MSDAPLADPGVRNYRTGLLRNARRWNHDHHWDWLDRCNHAGLSNITATLGSFYWLGFETSGLSPDKKRLAWLGAQRCSL